jgi:hypothetical protein
MKAMVTRTERKDALRTLPTHHEIWKLRAVKSVLLPSPKPGLARSDCNPTIFKRVCEIHLLMPLSIVLI